MVIQGKYVKTLSCWAFCILLIGMSLNGSAQPLAWAKAMQTTNQGPNRGINSYKLATDTEDNIYIAGSFFDTVDFDPGPDTAYLFASQQPDPAHNGGTIMTDAFLAKYDANGTYLWAIKMGGRGVEGVHCLAIGKKVDFDPGPGVANLSKINVMIDSTQCAHQIFLAKYTKDGAYSWAKTMGGADGREDIPTGISLDDADNIYLAGYFSASDIDMDPGPGSTKLVNYNGLSLHFFAKYDSNGNFGWARTLDNSNKIGYGGISYNMAAVDPAGYVYFSGRIDNYLDFDPGPDTLYLGARTTGTGASSRSSTYVIKYDIKGNFIWAKAMESPGSSDHFHTAAMKLDAVGNIYITGSLRGAADFDPGPDTTLLSTTPLRNFHAYLAKYDSSGSYIWAHTFGADYQMSASKGLAISGPNVYITGNFNGNVDFDPGQGKAIIKSKGGGFNNEGDVFIAKYDTSGRYLCAQAMGSERGADEGKDIAVDDKGNVYVTGSFQDTVDFDSGPNTTLLANPFEEFGILNKNAFLLKLSCPPLEQQIDITTCRDSYELNGQMYTSEGTYTQRFENVYCGCDSTIILHLSFNRIEEPVIQVDSWTLSVPDIYSAYQWFKNGDLIPGATQSKYQVRENARYMVAVNNEKGCSDTSEAYEVTNFSSIQHLTADRIQLYPNPTQDLIHIESPEIMDVHIYTIEGKLLQRTHSKEPISLSGYANGLYLVQVLDREGRILKIEKVIRQ